MGRSHVGTIGRPHRIGSSWAPVCGSIRCRSGAYANFWVRTMTSESSTPGRSNCGFELLNVMPRHIPRLYQQRKAFFAGFFHHLQAPVYALIVLGCYALVSVGYALFTFRDCPEKREQLSRDIADAEAYLKQKGFVSPPPPAGWKA